MTDTVLETEGLTKRFGKVTAVDNVSLTVEEGEFRSVIGPNGAGKTTTFDLITGALTPTDGAVWFKGQDITELSPHERVARGLGRSFQITNVFSGLTVRENFRVAVQSVNRDKINPASALFKDKSEFKAINKQTHAILEHIDLADRADEPAETLAYGDQRRLEIGIVLATDPDLVMLDEPTAGMSSEETQATMDLISDVLADQSLMLIEHDIDLVMRVSDRITVLTRGQELASGAPEEIANNENVRDAYLGGARE
jgi:branched-chain amino acid transport system ATP-binding protein